jgi:hypothetical protein
MDQLAGHLFVRGARGVRSVPGSPIGIEFRIGRGGKRGMNGSSIRRRRGAIDP